MGLKFHEAGIHLSSLSPAVCLARLQAIQHNAANHGSCPKFLHRAMTALHKSGLSCLMTATRLPPGSVRVHARMDVILPCFLPSWLSRATKTICRHAGTQRHVLFSPLQDRVEEEEEITLLQRLMTEAICVVPWWCSFWHGLCSKNLSDRGPADAVSHRQKGAS